MAWNNPLFPKDEAPRQAIDTASLDRTAAQVGDRIGQSQAQRADEMAGAASRIESTRTSTAPAAHHSPFELAVNEQTGQVMLANGTVLKMDAPTMVGLATVKGLKQFSGDAQLPPGFRLRYTQAKLKEGIDAIPTESDFWGNAWASLKSTLGLAVSAAKSEFSDEDPSNAWSNAQQQHASEQTIGQYKATQGAWWEGMDQFLSTAGQNAGNVGGGILLAAPTGLAGAAAGSEAGPGGTLAGLVSGIGWAVSGGLPAYGDQATGFYSAAMDAMRNMTPEQLAQESPLYQRVMMENPSLSFDEAKKRVAAEGSRAAGRAGAVPGAIEAVVGSRLAGNFMAKLGFKGSFFGTMGKAAERTSEKSGEGFVARALSIGKPVGRMVAGGAGAAGMEMSETAFGQAAGAHVTGLGSDNPLDNINPQEGVQASQMGAFLGLFGGHGSAHSAARSDIADALTAQAGQQSPNGATAWSQSARFTPQPGEAPDTPAYLRRGLANGDGQREMMFPNDQTPPPPGAPPQAPAVDPGAAAYAAASQGGEPGDFSAEDFAPQPAPQQNDMFASQLGPQEGTQRDLQQVQQQQALQEFVRLTDIDTPEKLQANLPTLLDIADQNPGFKALMQAAGVYPGMIEQSDESKAQHASDALEQWNRQPATFEGMQAQGEAPLRAGTQVDVPEGHEAPNFGARVRGPESAQRAAVSMQVPSQPLPAVESPEPLAAPQERTPDGRPVGVAPAPLPNPEPMSPAQAQQAAATRARRRQAAGAAPSEVPADQSAATPEQVAAAAQASDASVSDTTAEPAEDIAAQVQAMLDPDSGRLAVYVAAGNEASIPQDLPPDVLVVSRKDRGTLLTVNPDLAKQFKRGKWTDQDTARVLGYSESKGEAIASGRPTVVEARTPEGAVAAQQLTTDLPRNKRAAAAAVARQARRDATVVQTTPEAAQADRAARNVPRNPVAAAVTERRREKKAAAKKKRGRKATADEERTDAKGQVAGVTDTPELEPAARLDVSAAAQSSEKGTLKAGNKTLPLADSLIHEEGEKGATIDLRVSHLNEHELLRLQHYLEAGKLSAHDASIAKARIAHYAQMNVMLDAAVDRAEQKLLDRIADAGAEGHALLKAAEQLQLQMELNERREAKERGRPHGRPKESPLEYVPLLRGEMVTFAKRARAEAKAALGKPEADQSVARRLATELVPEFEKVVVHIGLDRALQAIASLDDGALMALLRGAASRLKDSFLAKQVMRGASELARVHVRSNEDVTTVTEAKRARAARQLHESQKAGPVVVTSADMNLDPEHHSLVTGYKGDLPPEAAKTVNEWAQMMERGGIKLSGEMRVISMATARILYPHIFNKAVLGQYKVITENGKEVHVIAVDWAGARSEGHALETLAHEFGHYVSREVFNRSDFRTQAQILAAYESWLMAHGDQSPIEILRSHLPGLMQKSLPSDVQVDRTYAASFKEWSANHVARFLLTRPEPRSVVEKYFARVAEILRGVYAKLLGTDKPNQTWADALDAWISGAAAANADPLYAMKDATEGEFMHAMFGDREEELPGGKTAAAIVRRATSTLDGAKREFGDVLDMALGGNTQGLKGKVTGTIDHLLGTKLGALAREKVGLALTTLDQMERLYRDTPLGNSLSSWVRLQKIKSQIARVALHGGEFEVEKGQKLTFKGAAIALENANKLATKARNVLQEVMLHATRYGIHPDKAFTAPENKHLWDGVDPRQLDANLRRYATVSNLWKQMVTLDPTSMGIYTDLRDAFSDLHQHTLQRLIENIEQSGFSEDAKKKAIENVERARRELKEGPYFPLMRFGDWVVTAMQPAELAGKDGGSALFATKSEAEAERRVQKSLYPGAIVRTEKVGDEWGVRIYRRGVYFFDSPNAARAARAQIEADMREQFEAAGVTPEDVIKALAEKLDDEESAPELISAPKAKLSFYEKEIAPGDQFLQELRADMSSKGVKMDPEMAQIFENLYLESLPEFSARKAMLPRQNVMGASRQMLQSYAHRFAGAAHAYSGVAYGREINRAWQEMRKVRDESGFEPTGSVLNVLHANQQAIADRSKSSLGNKVANALTDLSSAFSLAFSPAYVLTNAMQPTMVTLPALAGATYRDAAGNAHTVGLAKAMVYLKDAYDGAIPFFSKRGLVDFVNEAKRLAGAKAEGDDLQSLTPKMIESFGRDAQERGMLTTLLERGRLDFSFLNSIEDAMRGGWASQKLGAVARLGMAFPQQVEAMNRVTTALAAYRVARNELGLEHAEAQEYASDVVGDTQLDYSRLNRPLAFNKFGLSVVLQFKLYVQGMYALFARNAWLAVMGADKAERKQGRATLAYLFGTHGAIGGIAGMPMAGVAKASLGLLAMMGLGGGGDDDKWKSPEELLHERAQGLFGSGASAAEYGLPTLLGLDVSDRLGFPSLLDSRYTGIREGDDGGTQMDKWTLYLLGAPYSNLRRIVQGVGNATDGDPFTRPDVGLPSGARALLKAYRTAGEGIVSRDGDTFIGADALSWRDLAITGLGFSPAEVQQAYRDRSEVKGTVAEIQQTRSLLLKRWRTAAPEEKDGLRSEIREFNDSTPRPFRITGEALMKSQHEKQKRDAGKTNKLEASVKEMMK